jgi:hypothetical protein
MVLAGKVKEGSVELIYPVLLRCCTSGAIIPESGAIGTTIGGSIHPRK